MEVIIKANAVRPLSALALYTVRRCGTGPVVVRGVRGVRGAHINARLSALVKTSVMTDKERANWVPYSKWCAQQKSGSLAKNSGRRCIPLRYSLLLPLARPAPSCLLLCRPAGAAPARGRWLQGTCGARRADKGSRRAAREAGGTRVRTPFGRTARAPGTVACRVRRCTASAACTAGTACVACTASVVRPLRR